jgi:trans-aconitate 2-methyltransferase
MPSSPWNPEQYERFARERALPFADLLAMIRPAPAMRVIDIGCGTGELTRALHEKLGARETLGIDSSETMLAKSVAFAGNGVSFRHGDIGDGVPSPCDLLFSNAALQWVPWHKEIFPMLAAAIAPGGQIAIQMPANFDSPAHMLARELAEERPFREALAASPLRVNVLAPELYAEMLDRLGFTEQLVRVNVYLHHLASRDEVFEWVRGTLLTGYESRLPAELFERFLAEYRGRLPNVLADQIPFPFPHKRLFLWGKKA